MANSPTLNDETRLALETFSAPQASPDERRDALTTLSATKFLPKNADDPAILAGKAHLIRQATEGTTPEDRLLAVAECIRLTQIVKRWAPEIAQRLQPAFIEPLPSMQLLPNGDDRLNVARACAPMSAPWLPDYLARAIAEEPTAEKTRLELMRALSARVHSLAELIRMLAAAFAHYRPDTQAPGDTMARRLARTLEVLREVLLDAELEAGDGLGDAIHDWISTALGNTGKPQEESSQIDLIRQVLLLIHDIVRTRLSVVADPSMYRVVEYCRRLAGGSWHPDLQKPLERLTGDILEALVLLGRQGKRDQALLSQLDVLCQHPERARFLAQDLAARHPELDEEIRDWLQHGRIRPVRQASASAIEMAASNADGAIGLALHAARRAQALQRGIQDQLLSSLEIYDPQLTPRVQALLEGLQTVAIELEQAAALRRLELYGQPGQEVEFSSKFFVAIGDTPRQTMIVRQPAIVRRRDDGSPGEVIVQGIVE